MPRTFLWKYYFLSNFGFEICHLTGKCLWCFVNFVRLLFLSCSSYHGPRCTSKRTSPACVAFCKQRVASTSSGSTVFGFSKILATSLMASMDGIQRPQFPHQRLAMWHFDKTPGHCGSRMHHMTATGFPLTPPPLLIPLAPVLEVLCMHCSLHRTLNKSHIIQHHLMPNCHAKALTTTTPHDYQDLLAHLPHHTTTMFCISISFLGARRQALYFWRNVWWFSLGLGLSSLLPQFCSGEILFCLYF